MRIIDITISQEANMKALFNKIEYNSPVVLTFSILAISIFFIDELLPIQLTNNLLVYRGAISAVGIFSLFSYPLGHGSIEHLLGNMTLILLIGPMLEEKYSSKILFILMLITTVIIGLVQVFIFRSGILGASGIVFMMIILTSFTNMKDGKIPLTFIFIAILFLSKEVYNGLFVQNNISELAHLLGAIIGMGYIYIESKGRKSKEASIAN